MTFAGTPVTPSPPARPPIPERQGLSPKKVQQLCNGNISGRLPSPATNPMLVRVPWPFDSLPLCLCFFQMGIQAFLITGLNT